MASEYFTHLSVACMFFCNQNDVSVDYIHVVMNCGGDNSLPGTPHSVSEFMHEQVGTLLVITEQQDDSEKRKQNALKMLVCSKFC